jgi:hypothetical protein
VSVRFVGQQPVSFMTLPWLGEVAPGDVLSGAAADAVAGRSDFKNVDEAPEQGVAVDAPVTDAPTAPVASPAESAPVKPRRSAAKPDAAA